MAVDTAGKRFTIQSTTLPWRMVSIPPDGATSAGNRIADVWLYSGIEPGTGVVTAGFICMRTGFADSHISLPNATGTMTAPKATGSMTLPTATGTIGC